MFCGACSYHHNKTYSAAAKCDGARQHQNTVSFIDQFYEMFHVCFMKCLGRLNGISECLIDNQSRHRTPVQATNSARLRVPRQAASTGHETGCNDSLWSRNGLQRVAVVSCPGVNDKFDRRGQGELTSPGSAWRTPFQVAHTFASLIF